MITKISTYKLFENLFKIEQKLEEGLILTHDIHKSKKALDNIFDFDNLSYTEIINNKIYVYLNNENSKIDINTFANFLILINNLGYYVAKLNLYNQYNNKYSMSLDKFKENYFNSNSFLNIKKMEIIIEPKYDITHKLKSNTLYHVTEERYLDRIKKYGLILKSKNTRSEYPERIYLVYNIDDANHYIKNKKNYYLYNNKFYNTKDKFQETNFITLKIELPEDNDLIFYEDPNFKDKGIYTYDNINPKYIKIIKN